MERLLVGSGAVEFGRRRMRGRSLILAYHNIVPRGAARAGELTLHLSQDAFAGQLDLLMETHDVVPLAAVLEGAPGRDERPRAAITFDDAYRGAVTAGVDEVTRRGLPATVFVAPAFVGGGTFWWDALAPAGGAALPARWRETALTTWRGQDEAVRRWAADDPDGPRPRQVPEHARVASEAELRTAAQRPAITVGSHSWSHPNLTSLPAAELATELRRPLEWLRQRFPAVSDVLAYPYGLTSPGVEGAAQEAGYRAALLVTGGWLTGRDPRFRLPRLNVPAGLSANGFRVRTAGWLCR